MFKYKEFSIETVLKSLEHLVNEASYDEAIKLLKSSKGKFDPGLYEYNLGAIYHLKGESVMSRYWLEQATTHGYLTHDSLQLLSNIKTELGVGRLEDSESFSDYLHVAIFKAPHGSVISLMLLLVLTLVWVVARVKDKYIRLVTASVLGLLLIGTNVFIVGKQSALLLSEVELREGPSKIFPPQTIVPKGVNIIYKQAEGNWKEIVYPTTLSGWVETNDLLQINDR